MCFGEYELIIYVCNEINNGCFFKKNSYVLNENIINNLFYNVKKLIKKKFNYYFIWCIEKCYK